MSYGQIWIRVARPFGQDRNGITLRANGEHMRPETEQSPAQLQPS